MEYKVRVKYRFKRRVFEEDRVIDDIFMLKHIVYTKIKLISFKFI